MIEFCSKCDRHPVLNGVCTGPCKSKPEDCNCIPIGPPDLAGDVDNTSNKDTNNP